MSTEQHDGGEYVDTIVIGGGQAGLAVGYYLARQGRELVILDEENLDCFGCGRCQACSRRIKKILAHANFDGPRFVDEAATT